MRQLLLGICCLVWVAVGCGHGVQGETFPQEISGKEIVKNEKESLILRLDSDKTSTLPKRFRKSSDEFGKMKAEYDDLADYRPTRDGLAALRISGSGQFSESEFQTMMREIRKDFSGTVYIVDLREESHGFINGMAASWYKMHNWANMGMTAEAIRVDEESRLAALKGTETTLYAIKSDAHSDNRKAAVRDVMTEAELAGRHGAMYVRFPCTDHTWPAAERIEAFIAFYRSLPDDVWLHFHCSGGVGRTAAFMALVDMMRNPALSLKDIAYRQALLGGNYLLYVPEENSYKKELYQVKSVMFQLLYKYVQENRDNDFQLGWKEYLSGL